MNNEICDKVKKMNGKVFHNFTMGFVTWIHRQILFFVVVSVVAGVALGLFGAKFIYDYRMSEIVKVGGFVHDKQVYDVKARL